MTKVENREEERQAMIREAFEAIGSLNDAMRERRKRIEREERRLNAAILVIQIFNICVMCVSPFLLKNTLIILLVSFGWVAEAAFFGYQFGKLKR